MKTFALKISGAAEIEAPLVNDTVYEFVGEITTFSVGDERSKQNGDYEVHHKAKFTGPVTLIKGDKTMIKGKGKGSMSSKLHGAIYHLQDNLEALDQDEEQFCNQVMGMLISNLPEIYDRYKS